MNDKGSKINVNTLLLALVLPAMGYLMTQVHALDVRLTRIEQAILDGKAIRP